MTVENEAGNSGLRASAPKATALLDLHRELGAKLTAFGGWDMPLQYSGVITEHNAVRTDVGIFDVSHLGKLLVSGPKGGERLQFAVTADVLTLEVGRATYALVLTDEGGCVDDVFVYRLADDRWLVVPNASNVEAVAERITGPDVEVVDAWDRWAILAIQGPRSFEAFEKVFPGSGAPSMPLHSWMPIDVSGIEGLVARTGYTGERGFELYTPTEHATKTFEAFLDAGCVPVGLGARDTLRLEMGYALYGHELALDINPLEAGLGWAIAWDTPFRGKEELLEIKAEGPARKLFGVVCTDRGVPRQDYPVYAGDRVIGTVTSGNHSPTLQTGIALAIGPREDAPSVGMPGIAIAARGRMIPGDIVKPPFVTRR